MIPIIWHKLSKSEKKAALARPQNRRDPAVLATVKAIFEQVEKDGFDGLSALSQKFDGHAPKAIELDYKTVDQARSALSPSELSAMELAVDNVRAFHQAERPDDGPIICPIQGVSLQRLFRPISTAGLYVPGGTAPLFSTLIMTAVPAQVAGVKNRVAITPPAKDGSVHPMMIAAAAKSGLDRLWAVGGAHGIAALCYGLLDGAPAADKIFGPGNKYVAEAKRYATECVSGLAIDMPAGPSELLVIADETANPEVVASDLLSQAEHDEDAQVILIGTTAAVCAAVWQAVARQVASLPREKIARASLKQARFFVARDLNEAAEISNLYAPEHLSLQVADEDALIAQITAAGTIFAGKLAAETFGDYVAGPSHVLPTDGAARAYDGITVRSFLTSFVVQKATREGAMAIAPAAAALARLEGLEAHARAADIRLSL